MFQKISRIKIENIISISMLPYYIYQFFASDPSMKIASIVLSIVLASGLYYGILETRKDFKKVAKEIDETIKEYIETIIETIKKEVIKSRKVVIDQDNNRQRPSFNNLLTIKE